MNLSRHLLATVVAASTLCAATSSFADTPVADGAWNCSNVTFATAATDCYGSVAPAPNDGLEEVNAIIASEGWGSALTYQYKDENSDAGTDTSFIDAVVLSNDGGYVSFSQTIAGPLVLTLKLGQSWSAYFFGAGVTAGDLAYTVDMADTTGMGLSHAALFTNTPAVPEPETYALMLAGLGVMGFLARRRKPD